MSQLKAKCLLWPKVPKFVFVGRVSKLNKIEKLIIKISHELVVNLKVIKFPIYSVVNLKQSNYKIM